MKVWSASYEEWALGATARQSRESVRDKAGARWQLLRGTTNEKKRTSSHECVNVHPTTDETAHGWAFPLEASLEGSRRKTAELGI
eukprot:scaffold104195_cov31-Tisochrysis_lutea.AAC.1